MPSEPISSGTGSAPHKQRNEAGKWSSKYARSARSRQPEQRSTRRGHSAGVSRCRLQATWHRQCRFLRESGCRRPRVGSDRCWRDGHDRPDYRGRRGTLRAKITASRNRNDARTFRSRRRSRRALRTMSGSCLCAQARVTLTRRQRRLSSAGGGLMSMLSPLYPRGPVDVSRWLHTLPDDGSVPQMPGWRWFHTPGHTPGHIALWREGDRTINAGDDFITTRQESAYAVTVQEPEMHGPPMYCRKAACYFLASLPAAHATRSRHDPKPEQS